MQEQQNNLVPFPARDLLKKCQCKEDIINITREMGNIKKLIV